MNYGMQQGMGLLPQQGYTVFGPQTMRSPQQKVTEGYGLGATGGVSPENIRFAAGVPGGSWENIRVAGFVPQTEPFANKVITSLSPVKTVTPYSEKVRESLAGITGGTEAPEDKIRRFLGRKSEQPTQAPPQVQQKQQAPPQVQYQTREYYKTSELPGGPVYPRPPISTQPTQLLPIPRKAMPQPIMQPMLPLPQQNYPQPAYPQPAYPQPAYPQQNYPQQPVVRTTRRGGGPDFSKPHRPDQVWSVRSQKWVEYERPAGYSRHKNISYVQQNIPQQFTQMQPQPSPPVWQY